ncbi:MAG: hypothetical protein AAFP83_17410 [Bacteroidota bacterium]
MPNLTSVFQADLSPISIQLSAPGPSLFSVPFSGDTTILKLRKNGKAEAMINLGFTGRAYIPSQGFDYRIDSSSHIIYIHLPDPQLEFEFPIGLMRPIDLRQYFRISFSYSPIEEDIEWIQSTIKMKVRAKVYRRLLASDIPQQATRLAQDHYKSLCEALGYKVSFEIWSFNPNSEGLIFPHDSDIGDIMRPARRQSWRDQIVASPPR